MLIDNGRRFRERDPPYMRQSFAQFIHNRPALRASMFGVVLSVTACASLPPPTSELATAQQAVSRADNADADQYAAGDFAQARSLLEQAHAAMADGDRERARNLALLAAARADLANALSRQAVTEADLKQRRAEIADLKRRIGVEDGQ